jgi:murein DD-endopeptidase MepM/ murein hydrolase activator NlpD
MTITEYMLPFSDRALTGHFGKIRTIRGKQTSPHRGTDWGVKVGTPIPAISKGTIMQVQFSKILGWTITHSVIGFDKKVLYASYCHMDKKPTLKVGDKIDMGDTVGLSGNTGLSSGPHVHVTLSDTVKGVFYGNVYDVYKYVSEQMAHNKAVQAKAAKVAPKPVPAKVVKVTPPAVIKIAKPEPVKPKTVEKIIYACPHCKKELK